MSKRSHEIFADFYSEITSGSKRMAAAFRIHRDVCGSWARPVATEINPTATGKNNPIDGVKRVIDIIHPHDPVRVREIVTLLNEYCDQKDRDAGFFEAEESSDPCAAVRRVVESQMQLTLSALENCGDEDPEKMKANLSKTKKLKAMVIQLEGCYEQLLKSEKNKNEKPKRKKGITR